MIEFESTNIIFNFLELHYVGLSRFFSSFDDFTVIPLNCCVIMYRSCKFMFQFNRRKVCVTQGIFICDLRPTRYVRRRGKANSEEHLRYPGVVKYGAVLSEGSFSKTVRGRLECDQVHDRNHDVAVLGRGVLLQVHVRHALGHDLGHGRRRLGPDRRDAAARRSSRRPLTPAPRISRGCRAT